MDQRDTSHSCKCHNNDTCVIMMSKDNKKCGNGILAKIVVDLHLAVVILMFEDAKHN